MSHKSSVPEGPGRKYERSSRLLGASNQLFGKTGGRNITKARKCIHARRIAEVGVLGVLAAVLMPMCIAGRSQPETPPPTMSRVLTPVEANAVMGAGNHKQVEDNWHPPHTTKVWTTVHKGRTLRITQLPHCEHLETLITYEPSGETLQKAKNRLGGVAACTGSFHNSQSMALADFLQRKGSVVSGAKTGRSFVCIDESGRLGISSDYDSIRRKPGVSALALGQRLVPLQKDGFSVAFMNRKTDRMAIGLNNNFIFIVQGKTDIWRLAHFFQHKLPVNTAINCDGGHVVRGKAPVHLVFRWNSNPSSEFVVAESGNGSAKSKSKVGNRS